MTIILSVAAARKDRGMILKLIDLGHYHLANALRACKKESARPGVLRILREVR